MLEMIKVLRIYFYHKEFYNNIDERIFIGGTIFENPGGNEFTSIYGPRTGIYCIWLRAMNDSEISYLWYGSLYNHANYSSQDFTTVIVGCEFHWYQNSSGFFVTHIYFITASDAVLGSLN